MSQEKLEACCPHSMWMHDAAGRCEKEGCECDGSGQPAAALVEWAKEQEHESSNSPKTICGQRSTDDDR